MGLPHTHTQSHSEATLGYVEQLQDQAFDTLKGDDNSSSSTDSDSSSGATLAALHWHAVPVRPERQH